MVICFLNYTGFGVLNRMVITSVGENVKMYFGESSELRIDIC